MRFRHRAAAGFATLLLPLAGLVGLASPAQAAANATATFTKTSDWGTGFGGQWTVKNTGSSSISSWTVEWDFPSGTSVTSAWDADVTGSGTHWTAQEQVLQRHHRPGCLRLLRLQRRGLRLPVQLQAERRQLRRHDGPR
ncbi:cellulose binding domain-containing protein [Streptomyces echinatus]|uniref:cellulose binding domain-containing protein n=1 Tax=Streptomyces echinatus TaxID=67293 RepID=UPI003CD0948F